MSWANRYFTAQRPRFWVAFTPLLILAAIIFVRSPLSNYIFDEQEALLANPYVNGNGMAYLDAFKRDFWGLPHTRSIGSYRPIPNLLWRALWKLSTRPWLHHWANVVLHAVNGALIVQLVYCVTRRKRTAWLAGLAFVCCGVLTEAVTGVVGIADVLGGMGVILAVLALRLPIYVMPLGVFAATTFGLFSKESALVTLPLVLWASLTLSSSLHPRRPLRISRAVLSTAAAVGALVLYTTLRKRWFPVTLPASVTTPLPETEPLLRRAMHAFMAWFAQPKLPQDPVNNPLINAEFPQRVAGALDIYARGFGQAIFPWSLSGDYSMSQEPAPDKVVFVGSVVGAILLFIVPVVGVLLWAHNWVKERRERKAAGVADDPSSPVWSQTLRRRALLATAFVWVPVAYFPHSNIPVLLPTVRAERFWYVPVIGLSLAVAVAANWLLERQWSRQAAARLATGTVVAFFAFHSARVRMHAIDYTDDLFFWRATARSSPNSAKAHLNYSVMLGARGHLEERLEENLVAVKLAPKWPMGHVYVGDTLCRLKRAPEAWKHYKRGFVLAKNDSNLLALGLQCLWDEGYIPKVETELLNMSAEHPGTWLAYLARDIVYNGEKHGGVEKKYRPRGYDEGPKKD